MVKKAFLFLYLFIKVSFILSAQNNTYYVEYKLNGIKDTMAWLCLIYGNEIIIIDSSKITDHVVVFEGEDLPNHGLYKIFFNDTMFTDVIITEPKIRLESTLPDIIGNMVVYESDENKVLFDYWRFYFKIQDTLNDIITRGRQIYATTQGAPSKELDELQRSADQLDFKKKNYAYRLLSEKPDLFAPKLIWSYQRPDYRSHVMMGGKTYETEKEFYEKHFFDRLDFSDPRMIYTEVMFVMINDYLRTFADPPSSVKYINLIDFILQKAKANDEVYQYCVELFIRNFEAGVWEKVFIHLVENHYLNAPLSDQSMKEVYRKRVEAIKSTSIGSKVPNICAYTPEGEKKCLYDHLGNKILLIIWSLGCENCENIIPGIVNIGNQYEEKGLKVFGFTIADNRDSLANSILKYNIPFDNVSDYKDFSTPVIDLYNVSITPVMYLLDEAGVVTDKPRSIPEIYAQLVERYRDK